MAGRARRRRVPGRHTGQQVQGTGSKRHRRSPGSRPWPGSPPPLRAKSTSCRELSRTGLLFYRVHQIYLGQMLLEQEASWPRLDSLCRREPGVTVTSACSKRDSVARLTQSPRHPAVRSRSLGGHAEGGRPRTIVLLSFSFSRSVEGHQREGAGPRADTVSVHHVREACLRGVLLAGESPSWFVAESGG